MKVCLINPPFLFPYASGFVHSHCLGLRSLSAFLKEGGHEVAFIDALMLGFDNYRKYANGYIVGLAATEIIKRIPQDAGLIGVSVPFSILAPVAHDIAGRVKESFKDVTLVMGGVYPSTQPSLALTSKADYIVVGEGETPMKELADGAAAEAISGVYSRAHTGARAYPPARMIRDLDLLPDPDCAIPMMERYFKHSPRNFKGRIASILTSRGCPFNCEFCSIHPVYGAQWRGRSPGRVLDEIEHLAGRFAINSIEIEDDNFTLKKDRAALILEGIIRLNERGMGLQWRTPNGVMIQTLDEDIIVLMKRAGCSSITLALEHGDPEMLRIMGKKLELDHAFTVIESLVRLGIPSITIFLIVGYPGETRARFDNSLKYLSRIRALGGNITVCANIAQPYPGTALLRRCVSEGYIKDKDFGNFIKRRDMTSSRHFVAVTTPDFDAGEVLKRKEEVEGYFSEAVKC